MSRISDWVEYRDSGSRLRIDWPPPRQKSEGAGRGAARVLRYQSGSAEAVPRRTGRGNASPTMPKLCRNSSLRSYSSALRRCITWKKRWPRCRLGAHVFIEKPLSHESSGIEALISEARRRDRVVQIGYNMRFHPGLQILKELIDSGKSGRVLWLSVEVGQYLPDWRPWQHYRESYSARHELGGGIILDGSHELDYICWLLGRPTEVTCRAEHLSSLDVDVEDSAWIYLSVSGAAARGTASGFRAAGYTRTCKVGGRDGYRSVGFQCPGSAVVFGRVFEELSAGGLEKHPVRF
jgi:hypothetical protein